MSAYNPVEPGTTLGDLIHIPDVKTVIRLHDADEPELRRSLVDDFIPTQEVETFLNPFLYHINRGAGRGFFIRGNYGSGKSHLLAVTKLLLSEEGAATRLAERAGDERLRKHLQQVEVGRYLVVSVSLVDFSSENYLEDILKDALYVAAQELIRTSITADEALDRLDQAFANPRRSGLLDGVQELLAAAGRQGIVFLLDELSEFLRSKRDRRAFNEDIRYLQFLGEYSQNHSLWVVATLQERIEETGEIAPEYFKKIVDRYHNNIRLTGQHVTELIDTRLIHKKSGARQFIAAFYEEITQALGEPGFSLKELERLYPVHPATVRLLDELRALFSEHRGIVDFIHCQVKGDANRGVPGMLSGSPGELLTPDIIFDHFRDRIRETVEFRSFSEKVYDYFEREAERLFDEEQREMALRLVKLLVINAISVHQRRLTVEEAARALLCRMTLLDPEINYSYVGELLDKMVKFGAYVREEDGRYFIDLEADISLKVKRRLEYIQSNLFENDRRIVYSLVHWVDKAQLPLARWVREGEWETEISWQNTPRRGWIRWGDIRELSSEAMDELQNRLLQEETDFAFLIGTPLDVPQQRLYLQEELAPAWGKRGEELAIWLPRALSEREVETLMRALAYQLLQKELADDTSPAGKRAREYLQPLVEAEQVRVEAIFIAAYFEGTIVSATGGEVVNLVATGQLPFEGLVEKVGSVVCDNRYPRHAAIAPGVPSVAIQVKNRSIEGFFQKGEPVPERELDSASRLVVTGYLTPMQLVRHTRSGVQLSVDPARSPLVAEITGLMTEERISTSDVYWHLRKGPFGLSRDAFDFLLLATIFSGLLQPYSSGRRYPLQHISAYNLEKIDSLGRGELLGSGYVSLLAEIPWMPAQVRKGTFNVALQSECWERVIKFKTETEQLINSLASLLEKVEGYTAAAGLPVAEARQAMEQIGKVLQEIKVSYAPREGLERFLAAYQAQVQFEDDLELISNLQEFLAENLARFVQISTYLRRVAQILGYEESGSAASGYGTQVPQPRDDGEDLTAGRSVDHLKPLLDAAINALTSPGLIKPEGMKRLENAFEVFVAEYSELYLAEHSILSGAELAPYRKLLESPPAKILALLSRVTALTVENNYQQLEMTVEEVLGQECDMANRDVLSQTPECPCGFHIGDKVQRPSLAQLKARCDRGLREYAALLSTDPVKSTLEEHATTLRAVGRSQSAARLERLARVSPEDPALVDTLQELVNNNSVKDINDALQGRLVVQDKNLDELYEKLVGRILTRPQILQEVERWLASKGEVPGGGKEKAGTGGEAYFRLQAGPTRSWHYDEKQRDEDDNCYREPFLVQEGGGVNVLYDLSFLDHVCTGEQTHGLYSQVESPAVSNSSSALARFTALVSHLVVENDAGILRQVQEEAKERGAETDVGQRLMTTSSGIILPGKSAIRPSLMATATSVVAGLRLALTDQSFGVADTPEVWEEFYRQHYWRLDIDLAWLRWATRGNRELAGIISRLEQEVRQYQLRVRKAFDEWLSRGTPGQLALQAQQDGALAGSSAGLWFRPSAPEDTAGGLTFSELLLWRLRHLAREYRLQGLYILILDAARYDLMLLCREVAGKLGLQAVVEGFTWAWEPTTTDRQLEAWRSAGWKGRCVAVDDVLAGGVVSADTREAWEENEKPVLLSGYDNLAAGRSEQWQLLKFDWLDKKLHAAFDDYLTVLRELKRGAEEHLLPLLADIPPGAGILLAADHGYRVEQAGGFQYVHGGRSPEEKLAPWVLMKKGSTARN